MRRVAALLLLAAGALARRADAHVTSTGLARIELDGELVRYRLTLVLAELPQAPRALLAAAAGGDRAAADRVGVELAERVLISSEDARCLPTRATVQASRLGDDRVDLGLVLRCRAPPRRLVLRDGWASLLGEHHRTLARVDAPGSARDVAFSREAPQVTLELAPGAPAHRTGGFFRLGLEHILGGWDHLLFLAALLLRGGGLLSLLRIVTAFTVAHSASLALAVLGLVSVPPRVVEPLIAASIVWVAVENLRARREPSRRWVVSLAFGLVHGFGFATALQELSLPAGRLAWALLGFNLGVEAGQALVIAAALPLLLALRRVRWEAAAVRYASLLVAATGSVWLVQRVLSG